MLNVLKLIGAWSCLILLVGLFVVNGAYMLLAPRKWMTQERWYFNQGSLRMRRRYLSGRGDWELRLTGAILLIVLGYCFYSAILR